MNKLTLKELNAWKVLKQNHPQMLGLQRFGGASFNKNKVHLSLSFARKSNSTTSGSSPNQFHYQYSLVLTLSTLFKLMSRICENNAPNSLNEIIAKFDLKLQRAGLFSAIRRHIGMRCSWVGNSTNHICSGVMQIWCLATEYMI